jgi:NTE family protein
MAVENRAAARPTRVLVLGGGGPVGRAWEAGLISGFIDRGIDLTAADRVIGTSAGAVVGAHLAITTNSLGSPPEIEDAPSVLPDKLTTLAAAMARASMSPNREPILAEIGKITLDSPMISEAASLSRSVFAPFTGQVWPEKLRVTAVNARTGKFRVWDGSSGIQLNRAIAASMAAPCVWPPITIDGERYIDGAIHSTLNADLAIGYDLALTVSCFGLASETTPPFFKALNACVPAELDAVRKCGASLIAIEPQAEFLILARNGSAMMDGRLANEAWHLGRLAANEQSDRVRRGWNGDAVAN